MFTEDMTAFFEVDELAVAALYDSTTTIHGNFNAPYASEFNVAGTNPTFECAASSVPVTGVGKTLVIDSITYRIRERQPQDDGAWLVLQLEQQ